MPRCFITFVSCVCVLSAFSQSDSIRDQVHVLDTVVVSRLRSHRSVQSTAPLHTLGRSDMLSMGVTDMADALHRLPGITLRDYGGAGGMKTVSVRGFGTQHTGVSYDGVMLSNMQTGDIDLSRYSLAHVSQIMLTIGDNADIFIPARQATTPAVLSIETMGGSRADRRPHFDMQLGVGSFGYLHPSLRYEQNVSQPLRFSVIADYVSANNNYPYTLRNGTLKTRQTRSNSRMQGGHVEGNVAWMPKTNQLLKVKAYYYDNHQQLPGVVRYYANESSELLDTRNYFVQTQYLWQVNRFFSMKWLGKWDESNTSYRESRAHSGPMDADYHQDEAYTSLCLLFSPDKHWALSYAADYAFHQLHSSLTTDIQPYRHSVWQSLTAKYHLQRLTAQARLLGSLYQNGARAGTAADNQKRLSPSLSLSWAPFPHQPLYVRASYKNIFRMPTFNENYFFRYGSKDLKPEQTDQLNVGVTVDKSLPHVQLWATLDGYLNHVTDKIVAVPYNLFVWRTVNVGKVRIVGIDAMLRTTWRANAQHTLMLMANYSYQRAANRTLASSPYYNYQIAYVPLHAGGCSLNAQNRWLNLTLQWVGVGGKWLNNQHHAGSYLKGYQEWSLTAYRTFRVCEQPLQVRADIKNILNRQYQIVAGYPMPGIHAEITMNYKF